MDEGSRHIGVGRDAFVAAPAAVGSVDDRTLGPRRTVLIAVGQAACFVLAFPPYGLWPLVFLAPAGLAWLALRAQSTRVALLAVLAVQWAAWMWIQRWLTGVTAAGYPALAMYLSLYAVAFVWIVRRAARIRDAGGGR